MTDQSKKITALIINRLKPDPTYLEKNFIQSSALITFQVLNKITAIDRRLISGGLLARVTKFLINLEIKPGGPYSEDKENIDQALNTEIALFLHSQGVYLPSLKPFARKIPKEREYSKIFDHIHALAEKSLKPLPKYFQEIIQPKITSLIQSDQDKQILLLAYFFKLSLGNSGAKITPDTVYKLGLANLFLWLSYSIYDDLIDNDDNLSSLPIANWAAREFSLNFYQQKTSPEYQLLFKKIMTKMDYSQIWESHYGRFSQTTNLTFSSKIENYQKPQALSAKSLAHCLGPMLILDQLKLKPNSGHGQNVLSFFKYYLSVRQLQDDIHDFESDYQKGIITSANIRIIKNKIEPNKIFSYFIKQELPRLNAKIIRYQNKAETYLKAATIIKYPDYLKQFLTPLKSNPLEIKKFLSTYQNLSK